MNILFNNINKIKIRRCERNIYKAMKTPVEIYQTNKIFSVIIQPKNAYKWEFSEHLWLPFLDQPRSEIVVLKNYFSDI